MASSAINARELKDIVTSKQKENVADASETFVLRSRVEQQADLIMMLKARNEELKEQVEKTEQELSEAKTKVETMASSLKDAVKSKERIEANFKTLNSNHEQILLLKDQYKSESEQLRKRLAIADAQTEERVAAVKRETEGAVAQLSKNLGEMNAKLEILTAREVATAEEHRAAITQSKLQFSLLAKEHEQCQSTQGAYRQELQANQSQATLYRKKAEEELTNLRAAVTDRDGALALEQQRTAALRAELEAITLRVSKVQGELELTRGEMLNVRAEKEKLSHDLTSDTMAHKLASVTQEYAAFKKHTTELLAKEREINARLRHLSSQKQ